MVCPQDCGGCGPDGSPCDDGDACTQTDVCQSGACVPGTPVVCAPIDDCHDAGTCDSSTGQCSTPAKPDGTSCDDHDACTQTDVCQSGSCAGGNPVVCPTPQECHLPGTCDSQTGSCSNPTKPDGFACDDGDPCTTVDACTAGTCMGSHVGADSDADGYCDAWEIKVNCNAHDFFEIPAQGNAIQATPGGGVSGILMTFAQPSNRRVVMGSDPSCAASGTCGPRAFCTAGKIGDPCLSNADCNEAPNTCRVVINYAAAAGLQITRAVMNRNPISGFTPVTPGCARKVDVLPTGHTHTNRLILQATGTVQGRPRRERDAFRYLK